MKWKLLLEAATEAVTEAADTAQGQQSLGDFTPMLDIILLGILVVCGVYALYAVIRLHREYMLFPNSILYPGDCPPAECKDVLGFIDYMTPLLITLGAVMLVLGAAFGLNMFVFKLESLWISIAELVLPVGLFVWYIIAQRKAAKRFW